MDLAGTPGGFFAGLCFPRFETGGFVITSTDGGSAWEKVGLLPAIQDLSQLAAANPSTLAVATGGSNGNTRPVTVELFMSTNTGQNWTIAASDAQEVTAMGVPSWLGFETSEFRSWIGDPTQRLDDPRWRVAVGSVPVPLTSCGRDAR